MRPAFNPIWFSSRESALETLAEFDWHPADDAASLWAKITCAGTEITARLLPAFNNSWHVEVL